MNKYYIALIMAVLVAFKLISQEAESQEIQMETPEHLYKIVSTEEWQESLLKNQIVPSPLDKDFFHLAKEDQVLNIVQKFWNNREHIVLKIDSKKLRGRLIYETNPGGTTKYYHLYDGTIPLEAVADIMVY